MLDERPGWEQLNEYERYETMGLTAKNSGGDFEMTPAGVHIARCYRIIDLGTHYDERWNKSQHKVSIGWELPDEKMSDGRPFTVHSKYTVSLHEKARLRQDLAAWRGRDFSEQELDGFKLPNLLGVPCQINIVHNSNDGKTFANVASIMPLGRGQTCPEPINETVIFDLDNPDWDVFGKLSEKMQDTIRAAREFTATQAPPKGAPSTTGQSEDDSWEAAANEQASREDEWQQPPF